MASSTVTILGPSVSAAGCGVSSFRFETSNANFQCRALPRLPRKQYIWRCSCQLSQSRWQYGPAKQQTANLGRAFQLESRGTPKRSLAVRASGDVVVETPSEAAPPAASFKHILLPIIDSNPYLSSGTRAAASTATSLARAFGSDITVAVVDEGPFAGDKELRSKNIRWHLAEGGFENFKLIEKEGQNPGAAIGEIADDMNLDLVVLGMESIHSKQIDGNTLAEFVPCPVLLLP